MYIHRVTENEKKYHTAIVLHSGVALQPSYSVLFDPVVVSFVHVHDNGVALFLGGPLAAAHNVDLGKQKQRAGADDAAQNDGQHLSLIHILSAPVTFVKKSPQAI